MSNFMQRQVTGLQNWLRVKTTHGTEFVSIADTSLFVRDSETRTHPMTDAERAETVAKIRQYTDGKPQSWENVKGHGARLSAPGYLDCTEWAVFDTKEEAETYLEEMYPNDEEQDEPEKGVVSVNDPNADTIYFLRALKCYQDETGDLTDAAELPANILSDIVQHAQRLKRSAESN